MKRAWRVTLALIAGVVLLTFTVGTAAAMTLSTSRITTDPSKQQQPAIDGTKITYTDFRTGVANVFMYNLATHKESQITSGTQPTFKTSISGNWIVWGDDRGPNQENIYLYDLGTHLESAIETATGDQDWPVVSGTLMVWSDGRAGGRQIWAHNFANAQTWQIGSTPGVWQGSPAISGTRCVWDDTRNGVGHRNVYMYDFVTATETPVSLAAGEQGSPSISGTKVVWDDRRAGNADIWIRDMASGTEHALTTEPHDQQRPSISGNFVVWEDNRNGNWDVYGYDLETKKEFRVTNLVSDQTYPAISGRRIVWEDARNGTTNHDIYLAEIVKIQPSISKLPKRSSVVLRRTRGRAYWTTSGTLKNAKGKVIKYQTVYLQSSPDAKTWKNVTKLSTNRNGMVSKRLKFTKRGTTYFRWFSPATPSYWSTASKWTKVRVK